MMFRQFPSVVIPFTLAVSAACSTETLENNHIFAGPAAGESVAGLGWLMVESYLPMPEGQALRVRLNGRDLIWGPEIPTFVEILAQGGSLGALVPAGDYEVEVLDRDGKVWTTAGPVQVLPPPQNVGLDRLSFLRLYGDAANPTVFIHAPIANDQDVETSDVTVRNGRASGRAIELERCVTTAVDGSNPDCESLGQVGAGDTWTGAVAISHASFPFVGEAWLRARGTGEGDDPARSTEIFAVNDPDGDGVLPGCQARSALITDLDLDGVIVPYSLFSDCGSY